MTRSTNSSLGHLPDNASKSTVLARRFSGHLKIPSAVQNFFGYFKNVHATGASSHDKSKASITATEPPMPTPSASKCASSRTEYASTRADVDDNQIKAVLGAGELALTNAESDETSREGQPLDMTGGRKSIGESIERDIENSTLAKNDDQEEEYRFDAKQDDVDRDSDAATPEATNDGSGYPPGTSNLKVTHDNRKNSSELSTKRPTTSNSHMHTAPDRRSRSPQQQHLHPSRKRSRSVVDDEDHYHRDASALVLSKPAAKRVRRVDNSSSLFTSFSGSRPQNEEQRRSQNDGHSRNGLGSSRTDGAFERCKSVNAEVASSPSSPSICRRKRGRDESQDNVQDQLGLTFFQDSQVISGGDRVGPISESEPAGRSRKRLKWTAGGPGNSHNHRFNSIEKVHHPLPLHGDNCGNAALIRQESEAQLQLPLVESSAEVPPACVRRRENRLDALWHRTVLISPDSGHAIPYDSPHPRNSEEWRRREEEDTRKWRNRFERVFE